MAYFELAFLSLLWGFSFLLIKIAAQAFDWIGYAFGRAGVAALALAAVALARRVVWPRSPEVWGRMAAMSLTGQVGPFLLFGVAAHMITSADMALMMGRRRSSPSCWRGCSASAKCGTRAPPPASRSASPASSISLGSPFAAADPSAAHPGLGAPSR